MGSLHNVCILCILAFQCFVAVIHAEEVKDPKVLILGAGMSGIAAAKTLHDSGFDNFLILEGSPRIGGRMKETTLGNYTVEVGAIWIYGKGSNPIYALAVQHNLSFVDSVMDKWTVRNKSGIDVTKVAYDVYDTLEGIIDVLDHNAKEALEHNGQDFTVVSALRNLNWFPTNSVDDVVEAYLIDFEKGVSPSALSGKHLHINEPFETFEDDESLIVTDKKGFSSLAKKMLNEFLTQNDTRLLLNKYVTNIDYSDDLVKVTTKDGSLYEADYAIVTFSIGVLQQREVIFSPALPQWKMMAIDRFGICPFLHIHLQFPYTFWDSTMNILYASDQRGKHSSWLNMNVIYPGSNIIMLSVFSEEAVRIERLEDKDIINELTVALQAMYPTTVVPYATDFKISRWLSDPLFRGAFSYWPPTFTFENMDELGAPVGRLHFAGEHINKIHYGFVHSAYMSGLKTASELIKCLDDHELCSYHSNYDVTFNYKDPASSNDGSCLKSDSASNGLLSTDIVYMSISTGIVYMSILAKYLAPIYTITIFDI